MNQKTLRGFMLEAHRRIEIGDDAERGLPLTRKWVGLGTAAAYKPMVEAGYMTFHDGKIPPPRCMGWLVFTETGAAKYQELLPDLQRAYAEFQKAIKGGNGYLWEYSLFGGLARA